MGILDVLLGNGGSVDKGEELRRVSRRLEKIESALDSMNAKMDDKFETVLRGIDAVAPDEKGKFITRLEERLAMIKKGMVEEAVVSECVRDSKSYTDLRKGVRTRTGLALPGAFLDTCVKRLEYEGKIAKAGTRFTIPEKAPQAEAKEEAKSTRIMGATPSPGKGGSSLLCDADLVLKVVRELEAKNGSVPVDAVVCESAKLGVKKESAIQVIDEHLMVTGSLYEPKQGFVKLVRPVLA